MSDGRAYPRPYSRPVPPPRSARATISDRERSNAAVPVAVVLVVLGLYLARYSLLAPGLVGLLLLFSGGSFLSARLNPLSPHFYLSRKPSWLAVGVVLLGGVGLLYYAYTLFVAHSGPVLPGL